MSIEYKTNKGCTEVWCEQDEYPYEYKLIGTLEKGVGGFYRFYPRGGGGMTCKNLRTLSNKVRYLNCTLTSDSITEE